MSYFGKKVLPFVLFVALFGNCLAQGTRVMESLTLDASARSAALGGAYVPLATGAEGLFWNPAGAAQAETQQFMVSYNNWVLDMMVGHAALLVPFRFGTLGMVSSYFSSGEIPKVENFLTVGQYEASDMMAGIAYSFKIGGGLAVGVLGKYLSEKIETVSATGMAADLGFLYAWQQHFGTRAADFRLAVSWQNIGYGITFIEDKEPLPARMHFGASTSFREITLAAAGVWDLEKTLDFTCGAELLLARTVFLRIGFHSAFAARLGFGLRLSRFQLDYAFVPVHDLGNAHIFTFLFVI